MYNKSTLYRLRQQLAVGPALPTDTNRKGKHYNHQRDHQRVDEDWDLGIEVTGIMIGIGLTTQPNFKVRKVCTGGHNNLYRNNAKIHIGTTTAVI